VISHCILYSWEGHSIGILIAKTKSNVKVDHDEVSGSDSNKSKLGGVRGDIIKVDVKWAVKGVAWIQWAQVRVQLRVIVNTAMNLGTP
jgi:hypothetical protein